LSERERLTHIRRPTQMLVRGRWEIRCDCGWSGTIDPFRSSVPKTKAEIEDELDQIFVAHLPPHEHRLYILVDQRQVAIESEAREAEKTARGNFIMPIGTPCLLTKWRDREGVKWASYLVPETGEAGDLPVGEIRTADNKVFKIDAPA